MDVAQPNVKIAVNFEIIILHFLSPPPWLADPPRTVCSRPDTSSPVLASAIRSAWCSGVVDGRTSKYKDFEIF